MKKGIYLEPFKDPPELRKTTDYLRAIFKIFPALVLIMKYGKMNCKEYFQKLNFKNDLINTVFNRLYSEIDFSALAFLLMLSLFNQKNAGYVSGGSLPIALRMTDKYKSLGGRLTFGKRVKKIIVENGKASGVLLDDGTGIDSDYVISAADGHSTIYDMLEGKFISKEFKEAYENWNLFTPFVQVSFGINKEINADCTFKSFLAKGKIIGRTELKSGYSLMNYSFDPTMAPKGKTVIILRYESPWEIWENMNDDDYESEKEKIEKEAIEILEKQYPGIKENIEVVDIATPVTGVKYTGVWKGSYEGFMPSSKNITKTLKMYLPGLENFYMAGQWLFPGGGLPPSAQSGKWVFQLICKKDKKIFKIV
jgi:phytoene dehydrogenase-like protein